VKRFSKGFLAYAGSGKNSRSNQLIVALQNNEGLGGGSPWEVPWGEVVGDESFATLDKIYTGYGEKGPSQGRLSREGSSKAIFEEFPNLDYILSCEVIDSEQKH
jgi:cyclophilin family peptidyl-prolyl cis-trans isomerase